MLETLVKDPAQARTYSLRRSKHDALRRIAAAEGHNNASRVLDRIVEKYLRHEFGRRWTTDLDSELSEREEGVA